MESVKDDILEIVAEYRQLPADYLDIGALIFIRKKLATLGVNLAVEIGAARKAWKKAETRYDIVRTQKQIKFYKSYANLEKSKMYAKANTEELYYEATECETVFYDLDYVFRSLKEVQGELNQSISYLKDELKQTRFYSKDDNVKMLFIGVNGFTFVKDNRSYYEYEIRRGDPINNITGKVSITKDGKLLRIREGVEKEILEEIGNLFTNGDKEAFKNGLLELGAVI